MDQDEENEGKLRLEFGILLFISAVSMAHFLLGSLFTLIGS